MFRMILVFVIVWIAVLVGMKWAYRATNKTRLTLALHSLYATICAFVAVVLLTVFVILF